MPVRSDDRREITAFLGALCLFLSAVEYLIPKPLPFLRLGLANLPLLLGLRFLKPVDLILVLLLKVIGQGLVNGTLASYVFLFSLAGSVVSVFTMSMVYRLGGRHVGLVGVSLSGALASSLVQVALAVTFVFGETARVIAPFSIGSGIVTGLIIGVFAERFVSSSGWLKGIERRYSISLEDSK
ncbi:MAG: Gx transporter family protein [Spirochaetaceae bacterium]|nr:Gx transporter family protein [Spirochaetaceae bacterium]RKX71997.1 MAG: heptaprenyl diphosphate synthase [Spirochaetota bacterium]RKX80647.1 MAG: heptaprenyl diphosphate synthase [Spirochaetota bacterium]RKX83514.1 MAG: heptaprenyl diphosphate synthase [Spirochaetota bacterium]RKX95372.1 MAG: heptaprenyl diphosphate synthase [Spirochaetota bacterium]